MAEDDHGVRRTKRVEKFAQGIADKFDSGAGVSAAGLFVQQNMPNLPFKTRFMSSADFKQARFGPPRSNTPMPEKVYVKISKLIFSSFLGEQTAKTMQ